MTPPSWASPILTSNGVACHGLVTTTPNELTFDQWAFGVGARVGEGEVFAVDIGDDHFLAIERNQLHDSWCHVRGLCNS